MRECYSNRCDNVLEMLDDFEDSQNYYIVTKYMHGGNLVDYLNQQEQQPLLEEQTRQIFRKVATGLKSLHEHQILHRDIKFENILVRDKTPDSDLYIADLGISVKLNSKSDKASLKVGTPGYTAPEILQGQLYSYPADIWSLGCVLYQIVLAKLPFWDAKRDERKAKTCEQSLNLD